MYDGGGNLVKSVVNSNVTYYPSRQYVDISPSGGGETVQKYYTFGSLTVAAVGTITNGQATLHWILSDQVPSRGCSARFDHRHHQCGWDLEQRDKIYSLW